MQAIRTRYLPATNTKPSRMQAKCEARTIYLSYDHGQDGYGNHLAASRALQTLMNWDRFGTMVGGAFAGDYYWVFKL
jgi:hypothetical protein